MAENTRSLTEVQLDDTTIRIESEIIEQLKDELPTSFECLMCSYGFQSLEEYHRHQGEHTITQSKTLQDLCRNLATDISESNPSSGNDEKNANVIHEEIASTKREEEEEELAVAMRAEDTIGEEDAVEEYAVEETGAGDDDVIGHDGACDLEGGLIEAAMIADTLVAEVIKDTGDGGHLVEDFITPEPTSEKLHCSICNKSVNKKSKLAHERMHSGNRPYKCSYCGKGFTRSNDAKRHEMIHNREGAFECDQCDKTFRDKTFRDKTFRDKTFRDKFGLERHNLTHTESSQEAYVGETCEKSLDEESELKIHAHRNFKERDFKCEFCSKIFRDRHDLKRHVLTHSDEKPFVCDFCSKAYRDKYNLNRHMRRHWKPSMREITRHTSRDGRKEKKRKVTKRKTQYECHICLDIFSEALQLKKHKLVHVDSTTAFICQKCGKKFTEEAELNIHIYLRCKEKGLKCETCGKMFRDNHDLKRHQTIHSDERPFKCEVCANSYRDEYNLQRHVKKHYNEILSEELSQIKPKKTKEKQGSRKKKQFECNNCGEVFSRALHLKKHRISDHANQGPCQCDICGKYFKEFSKLKRHNFIHTNKPSIKCDTCGKGCRDRFDWKRHQASHTRKYDYICDVCDKGFRDSYDLKRHSRTHAKKKKRK